MTASTEKLPNRLINEASAYLLQHARNPVDWWPWCGEAFAKAAREDKPVFLSIGYSTCHWCHVMEKECFEDEGVAALLNENFVAIKVDREERPDVDHLYMQACQLLTGGGGWPLSVFLDGEKKPFYCGTYFPKHDRAGHIGFSSLLTQIGTLWRDDRPTLTNNAKRILSALESRTEAREGHVSMAVVEEALAYFRNSFDPVYGGFGHAPKFPSPHNLLFLLRAAYIADDGRDLVAMVEKTLTGMAQGGLFDQIGFGFSRYSTDKQWLVPHFEKMLYDNALLVIAYTEGYRRTGREDFGRIARAVLSYVGRDMRSPEGGFYAAEDADSQGEEGTFYLWTPREINAVLGETDGRRYAKLFGITDKGNFEGGSIPNLVGKTLGKEDRVFAEGCRKKLFLHREQRIHPFKDTKIIPSWNGLMLAGLALAARTWDDADYTSLGKDCAAHLRRRMNESGHLFADDYAFTIWGLIELYQTTFELSYLEDALTMTDRLLEDFWDKEAGGLFLNSEHGEQLLLRPKELYDGAAPSANSVFLYNALRLARLTGRFDLEDRAEEALSGFAGEIESAPAAYTMSLTAFLCQTLPFTEIVIVAESKAQATEMLAIVHRMENPFAVCLLKTKETKTLEVLAPFTKEYHTINGQCTAYVCQGHSCGSPIVNPDELSRLLGVKPLSSRQW